MADERRCSGVCSTLEQPANQGGAKATLWEAGCRFARGRGGAKATSRQGVPGGAKAAGGAVRADERLQLRGWSGRGMRHGAQATREGGRRSARPGRRAARKAAWRGSDGSAAAAAKVASAPRPPPQRGGRGWAGTIPAQTRHRQWRKSRSMPASFGGCTPHETEGGCMGVCAVVQTLVR